MPTITGITSTLTLLSSTTLGVDGTFDVSSISQNYNDLVLSVIARGTDAGASDALFLRFNNDSATNYDWQQNAFFGTSTSITSASAAAQMVAAQMPAAAGTASYFGMYQITIQGYASTTWVKRTMSPMSMYEVTAGTPASCANAGLWRSTAAVTRVQLLGSSTANLKAGSTLRIYGRV